MKKLPKNNPFKTPESYFENFMGNLSDKLSPEKPNLPEEDGFAVPENYFDGVHQGILDKLEKKEVKVVQLPPYSRYFVAAASVAAILMVIFGMNWNMEKEVTYDDLAASDIENYFETNEFDLSAYEIAEVIPLDALEINDILTTSFEEEQVLDYLDENIEDFETFNFEDNE